MRRPYQMIALAFLAISVYVVAEGVRMEYYTPIGPGPGFFPVWLGVVLGLLTLAWFVLVSFRSVEPMQEGFRPDRGGALRILGVLVALILFVALGEHIGFRLAMFGMLLFLLLALGRQRLPITVLISLAGSFGVYYAFHDLLGLHLPVATIEILQNLGL